MKKNLVTVGKKEGIQSQAAVGLVDIAGKYKCSLWLEQGNKRINAKSLMGVLSLKLKQGDSFYVTATGDDETEAFEALSGYITKA